MQNVGLQQRRVGRESQEKDSGRFLDRSHQQNFRVNSTGERKQEILGRWCQHDETDRTSDVPKYSERIFTRLEEG